MGLLFIKLSSVLCLIRDRHPNQGRRAWPLLSSWVVLKQDTLTCCHPDWTASGRIIFFLFFSESADIFLLTRGSDQINALSNQRPTMSFTIKLFNDID